MPITRHSSLTGWPSGTPQFCSFSRITGAFFTSLAEQEKDHSCWNSKCLRVHSSDSLQFWHLAERAPTLTSFRTLLTPLSGACCLHKGSRSEGQGNEGPVSAHPLRDTTQGSGSHTGDTNGRCEI